MREDCRFDSKVQFLITACLLSAIGCAMPPPSTVDLGESQGYPSLAEISPSETAIELVLTPATRSYTYSVTSVNWWGKTWEFNVGEYVASALPAILNAYYKNVSVVSRLTESRADAMILTPELVEFRLLAPAFTAGQDCSFSAKIRLRLLDEEGTEVETLESKFVASGPFPDAADVAREAVDLVLIDLVANADTAIVVLKSGE